MTFAVKLPAFVYAVVQHILHQATLSVTGTLRVQASCSPQARLLGTPRPGEMSGPAGATHSPGALAKPVGQTVRDDNDSASSMGASGFGQGLAYEHATPAPAPGLLQDGAFVRSGGDAVAVGMAAPGQAASQVGMSMKTASANVSDEDDEFDQLPDEEMREGVRADADMRGASDTGSTDNDLLDGRTAGSVQRVGAVGFMAAGLADVSPKPTAGVAKGSAAAADQTDVQLQWTVLICDQDVRLGSLVQDPTAAEGTLHIPPEMLEEDLNKLKLHLVNLLSLQQPDKDPSQNRYAMSKDFAVACFCLPVWRPACVDLLLLSESPTCSLHIPPEQSAQLRSAWGVALSRP